jgi:hypothetical protein
MLESSSCPSGGGEVLHLCELAALKHPLPKVRFWTVAQ